jgi:stress response protein YsnF
VSERPGIDIDTALEWRGRTVVDGHGERIGTFEDIYLDEHDDPAWAAVSTRFLGLRRSLVPLSDMTPIAEELEVPYDRQQIRDAPDIEPSEQISDEDADLLQRHYGTNEPPQEREDAAAIRMGEDAAAGDEQGRDVGGRQMSPAADDQSEDAMTRSEEELVVGTRRRTRGRARLRKYVVTEHVQRTIPVQREEVRVEYEPADAGDDQTAAEPPADRPDR